MPFKFDSVGRKDFSGGLCGALAPSTCTPTQRIDAYIAYYRVYVDNAMIALAEVSASGVIRVTKPPSPQF